jgi:hypothetical protein
MNAVQLLDRILDPVAAAFSPEVARRMLALKADDEVQQRIDELAAKSNNGELSDDERAEYKNYVDVIDLISVLQAKAQRVLDVAR